MRITVTAALCCLLMAGCAIQRAEIAGRAQTELIGMSKKDLLQCAGVPVRQERVGDVEFLAFATDGDSAGSTVGRSAHRYCEAAFVLKNDIVRMVNYRGRTGLLAKGEQCAFIVENCIKQ